MKHNELPKEYTMRLGYIVCISEYLICTLEGYNASTGRQTSIQDKNITAIKSYFTGNIIVPLDYHYS